MRTQCALLLLAAAAAQEPTIDVSALLHDQQRFHERVATSRWQSNPMDYVDGVSSAVLRHPYTLLSDPEGDGLYVASFTLNHVVRLRFIGPERKRAQYKVFVSGSELDGPVGMAVERGMLFVASFTNDHILRVNTTDGSLDGRIGDEDSLDCPEGLAIGPSDGRLYVASFLLRHLSVFDPWTSEYLGTFGKAAAPRAEPSSVSPYSPRPPKLHGAEDLTFDENGDVHVTAYYSDTVFKFNGTTGELESTYGRGVVGIVCDPYSGDIFVSAYKANQVLRFTPSGQFVGVAAGSSGGSSAGGSLESGLESGLGFGEGDADARSRRRSRGKRAISSPTGVSFGGDGTLWVASYVSGTVTRFNNSLAGGRTFWRVTD